MVEEIQKINSEVTVTVVQLDVADFSSIRAVAEEVSQKVEKLDILINNAGGRCHTLNSMLLPLIDGCSHGS